VYDQVAGDIPGRGSYYQSTSKTAPFTLAFSPSPSPPPFLSLKYQDKNGRISITALLGLDIVVVLGERQGSEDTDGRAGLGGKGESKS
jgi:hypothetical protein